MNLMRTVVLALAVLVPTALANAATYYVAKTGNNSNPGTEGSPWLTLTKAAATIGPNDTVIVKDGTYVESQVTIVDNGATIRAENKHGAILSSTSGCNPNISITANNVTIDGLSLVIDPSNVYCTPNSASGTGVRCWNGYTGCMVRNIKTDDPTGPSGKIRSHGVKTNQHNSLIEDNELAAGLETLGADNVIVRRNLITCCGGAWGHSIVTKGGGKNVQVYQNTINAPTQSGWGILLGGSNASDSPPQECYNCVAFANTIRVSTSFRTMGFQGCKDCAFFNNVGFGGAFGMSTAPTSSNSNNTWKNNILDCQGSNATESLQNTYTIDYNLFFNCTGVPSQAHPITGNPLFVNAASDYHLQAGSPAIGTGTVATMVKYDGTPLDVSFDFANEVRTSPWSLGIYKATAAGDVTPPTTPTIAATANGAKQISIAITVPATDASLAGYNLLRCTPDPCTPSTSIATLGPLATSYVDTNVQPGASYSYMANGFDSATPVANQGQYSAKVTATAGTLYQRILAYDFFRREDGTLGSNWDGSYSGMSDFVIRSGQVQAGSVGQNATQRYNNVTLPQDHWCRANVLTTDGSGVRAPGCTTHFQPPPTNSGYGFRPQLSGGFQIRKDVAGSGTILYTNSTTIWLPGDDVEGQSIGTQHCGYQVRFFAKTLIGCGTDSTFTDGKAGLALFVASGSTLDVQLQKFWVGDFVETAPVEATVTEVNASTTQASMTITGTPVWIRVYTPTVSIIEDLSQFPGGVYTYPDTIKAALGSQICFAPRNAFNEENIAGTKCDQQITVPDTSPPVMTNTTPDTPIPAGTGHGTAIFTTDEPADCNFDLENKPYDEMSQQAITASLTHSAQIGDLADGTTTHVFAHCADKANPPNVTTTALDIPLTVSESTEDTTPPGDVENLVAQALNGGTQAELRWSEASGGDVASYQIFLSVGSCGNYQLAKQEVLTTTTVVALAPNTLQCFVAKAIDTSNNPSVNFSNTAIVATGPLPDTVPPPRVEGLRITSILSHSAILRWNPCGEDNCRTVIEQCSGQPCGAYQTVTNGTLESSVQYNLQPDTRYCWKGKYYDGTNLSELYSDEVCTLTASGGIGIPRQMSIPRQPAAIARQPRN